jgi:rRNA-processing protein FCF1
LLAEIDPGVLKERIAMLATNDQDLKRRLMSWVDVTREDLASET